MYANYSTVSKKRKNKDPGQEQGSGFGCLPAKTRGLRSCVHDNPEETELSDEKGCQS